MVRDEEHKDRPPSDFPSLIPFIPVFSQRAVDALRELLESHGELLSADCLNCTHTGYLIFNVTRVVDALDMERSEFQRFQSSGRIMQIIHHEFNGHRLQGVHIFKVPQLHRSDVYVTDTFVRRVQDAGLSGFTFRPVWSGPET